jgi:hypothetical protein
VEDFAICGTKEISPDVLVETSDSCQVTLGTSTSTATATQAEMTITEGGPGFVLPTGLVTEAGAYAIKVDPFDVTQNRKQCYFITYTYSLRTVR